MIEKKIFKEKLKECAIQNFIYDTLGPLSCSAIELQRTPLGEKILVYTAKPGLIVGRKGANIRLLTEKLRTDFGLEHPQVEVAEITNPKLDSASVAKNLVEGFMRFGAKRFKVMAYRALEDVMRAGAKGVEIVISGRGLPGVRAKTWRFTAGYLKKSGDVSETMVDKSIEAANIKSGTVGIQVKILRPDVVLPDSIIIAKPEEVSVTVTEEPSVKDEAELLKKVEKKSSQLKKEKQAPAKKKKKEVSEESNGKDA